MYRGSLPAPMSIPSPATNGSSTTSFTIPPRPTTLAASNPDRLNELQILFYAEASKYNVLPIDNSKTTRMGPGIRPSLIAGRTSFTYHDGDTRIPEGSSPETKNRSFTVTAHVDIPQIVSGSADLTRYSNGSTLS
jgi:hypothetical protein